MARHQLFTIIPLVLLFLAIHTAANEPETQTPKPAEKTAAVVVEGVVSCQSCETIGSWSLAGAKAIQGAIVSVICKDHRNRVSYYKAFDTDQNGYFYAELKGFKMSHSFLDHPLHSCKVKLVSSPNKDCNKLTNVNYGLYGAPLRYEDKRIVGPHYEAVIYSSGPLSFRPAYCAPTAEDLN